MLWLQVPLLDRNFVFGQEGEGIASRSKAQQVGFQVDAALRGGGWAKRGGGAGEVLIAKLVGSQVETWCSKVRLVGGQG
jgi:hypothetical protein